MTLPNACKKGSELLRSVLTAQIRSGRDIRTCRAKTIFDAALMRSHAQPIKLRANAPSAATKAASAKESRKLFTHASSRAFALWRQLFRTKTTTSASGSRKPSSKSRRESSKKSRPRKNVRAIS
jgi:hypothetical protein